MAICTLEELLLQLGLGNLNLDGLVDLLLVSSLVVGIVLDGGGEKRVDEGSLAQTGFTSNLMMSKPGQFFFDKTLKLQVSEPLDLCQRQLVVALRIEKGG